MKKLGLEINGPGRSGVRGESVKSILGLGDWKFVNSA